MYGRAKKSLQVLCPGVLPLSWRGAHIGRMIDLANACLAKVIMVEAKESLIMALLVSEGQSSELV